MSTLLSTAEASAAAGSNEFNDSKPVPAVLRDSPLAALGPSLAVSST